MKGSLSPQQRPFNKLDHEADVGRLRQQIVCLSNGAAIEV